MLCSMYTSLLADVIKQHIMSYHFYVDDTNIFKLVSITCRVMSSHANVGSHLKPSDLSVSLSGNNIPELHEKLAVLVSTGKCKEAIGTQLTHDQLKLLTYKDVENYYKRYEACADSKTTESLMQSFLMLASKVIGMVGKKTFGKTTSSITNCHLWLQSCAALWLTAYCHH